MGNTIKRGVGGRQELQQRLSESGLTTIAPIVATSLAEVPSAWQAIVDAGADLVEWRLDLLTPEDRDLQAVEDLGRSMRGQFGVPVLATLRSSAEGGGFNVGTADGEHEYQRAVASVARWADMVDIEISRPGADALIIEVGNDALTVASFHAFEPPVDGPLLEKQILQMMQSGAIVSKVAAMVADLADLQKVHEVQDWAAELAAPTVVIGMGQAGKETRLGVRAAQNAFSFASVGGVSAPGQPTLSELERSCEAEDAGP